MSGALVALVTGANKGIGLETVRRLAGAGYRVYLTARNPELGKAYRGYRGGVLPRDGRDVR